MKSFKHKDDPPPDQPKSPSAAQGRGRFPQPALPNNTHQSTTDFETQRYRKGRGPESKLSFMGQPLRDNGNGLVVDGCLTEATGRAERTVARAKIEERPTGRGASRSGRYRIRH